MMTRRELKLAAGAGVALALAVGFLVWSISTREIEPELGADHCPADPDEWREYAIVLLDVSEALIGGNANELKRRVLQIGNGLQKHGKLTVFDLHDVTKPIVSMCRPQKLSECDKKTAPMACRGVQEAYTRNFEQPITSWIDDFLAKQSERDTSPIMEAIKEVSTLTAFRRMLPGKKSLIVVSDMLQNTPRVYSHYDHSVRAGEFATNSNHPFFRDNYPELDGTTVEVLYILRNKNLKLQTRNHRKFWGDYFRDANANSLKLIDTKFIEGDDTVPPPIYPPVIPPGEVAGESIQPAEPGGRRVPADKPDASTSLPVQPSTALPTRNPEETKVADLSADVDVPGTPDPSKTEPQLAGEDPLSPPVKEAPGFNPPPGTTFADDLRSGGNAPVVVVIPAGDFQMGCVSARDCKPSETPVHRVSIPNPFAMSKYEVTIADFGLFVEASGYRTRAETETLKGCKILPLRDEQPKWTWVEKRYWRKPGYTVDGRHPVACVSWLDATAYARWLAEEAGAPYRLPTETEWEYAARAGTSTPFHFGSNTNLLCRYGNVQDRTRLPLRNFWANKANCRDRAVYPTPVGSYAANSFQLHDMHGNLAEWVEDCWHPGYERKPRDGSARTASDCSLRVVRGGSWASPLSSVRSAARAGMSTGDRSGAFGFRVVRSLGPQPVTASNDPVRIPDNKKYCIGRTRSERSNCLVKLARIQR